MENERDKIILSSHGESYDKQYGQLDYKDKVVLDIGCYDGDTASYFLRKGAKKIIAVDINTTKISENYTDPEIVKIAELRIETADDYERLITQNHPDIVKIDCEGYEKYIRGLEQAVLRIPEAYTIEIHNWSGVTPEEFKLFFERNGFEVELVFDPPWHAEGRTMGLYARRKEGEK